MSKTSSQIAADIELKRQAVRANVEELRAKVHSLTDWRRQFERHPVLMSAAAMGAGALLATLVGRAARPRGTPQSAADPNTPDRPRPSAERTAAGLAGQMWEPLKDALIDIAVLRLTGLLERKTAGSKVSAASARHDANTAEVPESDPREPPERETTAQDSRSAAAVRAAARRA